MRFIITDKSFYLEEGGVLSSELQAWQEEFKRDKEYAWYLLGLKGCPADADISMRFLCKVAESYFRCLTSLPERIFFHLVENGREEEFPFAFLATYATKDESGRINHMPLQYALVEYQADREKLLKLLSCLNRASEKSTFVRVDGTPLTSKSMPPIYEYRILAFDLL